MGANVSEGHTTSILRVAISSSETVVTSCQSTHCQPRINHHTGANLRSVSNPYVMPFVPSKPIFTILGKHVRQARYVTYGCTKKWLQMAQVLQEVSSKRRTEHWRVGGRHRSLCSKAATSGLRFKLDTCTYALPNIREMGKFKMKN
jgi:hypothetical protein